jgi:rare lipoprotein A
LYRVKLGPFDNRKDADITANKVRKQLNISAIVTNQ